MLKQYYLSALAALILFSTNAQNSINLMSGKSIEGNNISIHKGYVHYDYDKNAHEEKHTKHEQKHAKVNEDHHEPSHGQIEIYRVFSIVDSTGQENIIYTQDTLHGRHYTIAEMTNFIKGEKNAFAKFKTPATTIVSGLLGAASGTYLHGSPILSLPAIFIIGFGSSIMPTMLKAKKGANTDLIENLPYQDGYKRVAKSRKLKNGIIGATIGSAIGIATGTIIFGE